MDEGDKVGIGPGLIRSPPVSHYALQRPWKDQSQYHDQREQKAYGRGEKPKRAERYASKIAAMPQAGDAACGLRKEVEPRNQPPQIRRHDSKRDNEGDEQARAEKPAA